jgi:arylsulfatase A-like enzyme
MVMSGPGVNAVGNVHTLVSLVDLMPTFLDLAGVSLPPKFVIGAEENDPMAIDGTSLVPLLQKGDAAAASHPDHVISQFHGENAGMSWFMLRRGEMKLVQWGTGEQHPPQLFNLTADPDEWTNLALGPVQTNPHAPLIAELDTLLKKKIDYPGTRYPITLFNTG